MDWRAHRVASRAQKTSAARQIGMRCFFFATGTCVSSCI